MNAAQDCKLNMLCHSEAKVQLLGEYLKRYLNIISNDGYTEVINIYDLFCGPGIYKNNGEGSPIVILRQVEEVYKNVISKKPQNIPKINCHFNDIDDTKVQALKDNIEKLNLNNPAIGKIEFTSFDYKILVESLVKGLNSKNLKNQKAFIFIDPYGYKDIKSEQLKFLMQCQKVEILLWLPTQHMYRFSDNGTPETLLEFIDELTPKFKEWKQSDSVWDFISQLKDGFQSLLGNDYFVDNFSIKKDEKTVFCLFFFTSHIKGFEKMIEAKWEIDGSQGKVWEYERNCPSLFNDYKTNELEDKLKIFIKSKKCYNGDVYEFTLRHSYLPKHAVEILRTLQENNALEVFLSNGEKARKSSFYIKYSKKSDPENRKVFYVLKN